MDNGRDDEVLLPKFKETTSVLPKIGLTAKQITPIRHKPLKRRGVERVETVREDFEETVELPMFKGEKKETAVFKKEETVEYSPIVYEQPVVKSKKKVIPSWISRLALLSAVAVLAFGTVRVVLWQRDNRALEKELAEVENLVEERYIEPIIESEEEPNEPVEVVETKPEDKTNKIDYSHLALVDVDFRKLKEVNPDTQAYIKINNLDVSVPVVQTVDNSYYLSHSFDKKRNAAGWIFGDYRNNWNNLKQNTIIYGHNRTTNVMFGSLKLMYQEKWYKNKDNHFIYISTPNKNMIFQIFSVYDIPTETYYLANEFPTDEMYQEFLDTIKGRSQINFETTPTIEDKLLTLSTCRTSTTKTVVHAKLVRLEEKN